MDYRLPGSSVHIWTKCAWGFPDKKSGVSSHSLLQGIFLTQGSNPHLLFGRQILYHWTTWEAGEIQSFSFFFFSLFFFHVLNPGLPLESPGALPTRHTDAPTGPRENSVGRAPGRLSLTTGHVTLMGNRWKTTWPKILSEPVQCIQSHEVRAPLWEVMNLQVWGGAMKWVFSKLPVCSDASSPRPTLRSPELQPSHSAQLRPLRREGFRAGISWRGQARTKQRKLQYLGFRPF